MVSFLGNTDVLLTNATYKLVENQFKDVFYHYIFPLVSFLACVLNILCACVLGQKELRQGGAFFQYSLVNSINSAMVTFLLFFMCLTNCGHMCDTSFSYLSQLYNIIAILFIVSTLYCFSSLIQISISFNLFLMVEQQRKCSKRKCCNHINCAVIGGGGAAAAPPSLVMLLSFLFSVVYGILFAISFRITPSTHITINKYNQKYVETTYHIHLDHNNKVLSFTTMFTVIVLNNVFLVMLVVVNMLILYKSRKLMQRKIMFSHNAFLTLATQSLTMTRSNTSHMGAAGIAVGIGGGGSCGVGAVGASGVNSTSGGQGPISPAVCNAKLRSRSSVHPIQLKSIVECALQRRQRQTRRAVRKILIMFLWISLIFCSSRFLFSVFCFALLFYPDTLFFHVVDFSNYFWASVVYFSYFFVYYKTNKTFRNVFVRKILKRAKL